MMDDSDDSDDSDGIRIINCILYLLP